jgi:enoyl-CoA hydratase/carnithine racemase
MFHKITVPKLLNPESIALLYKQVNEAEESGARFLVLDSSDQNFCEGLDLGWVTEHPGRDYLPEMLQYGAFLKKLQIGKFISFALIKGNVSGGGLGMVCACDYVIAGKSSTYSLPEGLLGLIPGMIFPALLNKLKPSVIKKMVFTGKKYDSAQALAWDIADEIVEETVFEEALIRAIGTMKSCKKDSIGTIKELVYDSHLSKDEYARLGMKILSEKLTDTEVFERLKDIVEFMKD